MSSTWNHVSNAALRWAESLNMSQWLLVLLVVVAVGAFCLKGFGSRSNY
ncbi:MAG: hypothetical protein K8T91_09620 [Planctomycetes bacterium]|nr:hypothetical protein [Planctomycetota bacterium]